MGWVDGEKRVYEVLDGRTHLEQDTCGRGWGGWMVRGALWGCRMHGTRRLFRIGWAYQSVMAINSVAYAV